MALVASRVPLTCREKISEHFKTRQVSILVILGHVQVFDIHDQLLVFTLWLQATCISHRFDLDRVHSLAHVVLAFALLKIAPLDLHAALNVALDCELARLVAARAVVDEEALCKLQQLHKEHVLDQAALATGTLAHHENRLLSCKKQLHYVVVASGIIGGDHDVLNQAS